MKALVHVRNEDATPWIDGLKRWMPDLQAVGLEDVHDPAEVDVAICWRMPHGVFATLPNLALIQSMAAGVDHILEDPQRPTEVPVARLVDPWMGRSMTHHVVGMLLRWHRDFDRFEAERRTETWPTGVIFDPDAVTVGILGMGHLGQSVAQGVRAMGFEVLGWSRSAKTIDGVETFSGPDGLAAMLPRCSALVCLLPLTEETADILNADLFEALPRGAFLINVGRGGHVAEADLIAALDRRQLSGAALDVFREEPLPKGHPFWAHPGIWPTPHIASEINLPTACRAMADNIRRIRAGETPGGLIDPALGY